MPQDKVQWMFFFFTIVKLLTNPVEQSLFIEDYSSSADQEFFLILWKPKFYYLVDNSQRLVHIRSQTDPVHALLVRFCQMRFNILFPSIPRSSE
jgi:hypothetical protein